MPANDYHFISHWRVLGTLEEVFEVLSHAEDLPRWWPATFVSALSIQSGEVDGTDRVVRVDTRGWLPYTLRYHMVLDEADPPNSFSIKAWGDLEGTGIWRLKQDDLWVDIEYDWHVRVNKPIEKLLSPLLRPLFASNHHWAMARGEESLRLELARRRAERSQLPAPAGEPPSAVQYPPLPVVIGSAALLAGFLLWQRRHD
jgi:hypothetical protein